MTALDWHPKTGLLLSCSSDRGIIVWQEEPKTKKFLPQLCNIKELKANTDACWSPRGDKFVVGAASGNVFVGSYNSAVGLWIAQTIADKATHDGPVTCVRFDPLCGKGIVSASTDGTVQFMGNFEEEIDGPGGEGIFGQISEPSSLFKLKCNEWVNTVSFSPSGQEICFATHDSTMHFFTITAEDVKNKKKPSKGQKFCYQGQPILSGNFIHEDCYIGSGYDKTPIVFVREGGQWKYKDHLDAGLKKKKETAKTGKDAFAGKNIYFEHPLEGDVHMKESETKHMNYINC